MNRLGAHWRYAGLGALIVVCLGLLVVAAANIIRIERQMQISATQNMTWIFGQTQIERRGVHIHVLRTGAGDPPGFRPPRPARLERDSSESRFCDMQKVHPQLWETRNDPQIFAFGSCNDDRLGDRIACRDNQL